MPDTLGVAGAFAGTTGGALLVAGGANFPGKMPWEGGSKVWHDTVYVLEQPEGPWGIAGRLPGPLGYGSGFLGLMCARIAGWNAGSSRAARDVTQSGVETVVRVAQRRSAAGRAFA